VGEGCVGLVKRIRRIANDEILAVKIVKSKDEETIENIKREFKNLR
jgi:hypothetical protein